jgi:putative ABC transport system ATP-binding protein
MESPIISLKNINKEFVSTTIKTRAVNNVSLDIYQQDFISIKGASGSGKSTLLSILGLLESFDSGEYKISDILVSALSIRQKGEVRNHHIGYIFQSFNLIDELSVWQNVALPLTFRNIKNSEAKKSALDILEKVGLAHRCDHFPQQLSGGQQQRVAIARALVTKPDFILADEPTGNLDSKTTAEIEDLLLELNQQGHSLIVVTHDEYFAKKAKRQYTMEDGELINVI